MLATNYGDEKMPIGKKNEDRSGETKTVFARVMTRKIISPYPDASQGCFERVYGMDLFCIQLSAIFRTISKIIVPKD